MRKLYIPKIKDKIRLVSDLHLQRRGDRWRDIGPVWRIVHGNDKIDWDEAPNLISYTLVAGTVLEFKRYFISSHAGENEVKVSIFASPRRDLTPRKNGGTSGRLVELRLTPDDLNGVEYEVVDVP